MSNLARLGDSESPAKGQQVITACALVHKKINSKEKVFLAKRASTKKFLPSVYEIPGGHIDFGESVVDGLKREFYEEFGVQISVGDPFACFTYINHVKQSHSIEVVYFAKFINETELRLDPENHSSFAWVSLDDVEQVYSSQKGKDDDEFIVVRKGLALLNGQRIDTA